LAISQQEIDDFPSIYFDHLANLVGGIPLRKMMEFVSFLIIIPNIWTVMNFHGSKPTTRFHYVTMFHIHFISVIFQPTISNLAINFHGFHGIFPLIAALLHIFQTQHESRLKVLEIEKVIKGPEALPKSLLIYIYI
jgi:hypothetical protein